MRREVLKAALWVFLEAVSKNVLAFGFTVVLARLLTPADFGVVAMLSLFVGIAATLAEGGLGAALIQAKLPSQADISTLFWTQLGMAAVLGLLLAASGPLLAGWFRQDLLVPLAIAYGLNLVVSAPASIHACLFMKGLQFRTPTLIALCAQIIAGMAAVVAALRGAGPWAIYVQTIVGSVMTTALLWHLSPWRPTRTYRPESLRRFLAFGGYGVGSGILGEIEQRVGSMVLGRYSGAFETGLFQRASSLQVMLARLLSGVVTRVAFPTFAALQEDPRRLLSAIREAVFINFAASALVMWIVALLAEPIIRIVFGPPWVPSAPVLQAFCVAGGFYPVFAVFSKALRAMGHARGVFVQHVVRAGGMATAAVLFGRSGFVQMAWAQAAFLVMTLPMGSVGIARRTGYGLKSQLMDLAPVVLAGVAMAFVGTQVARVVAPAGSDFLVILLVGAACSLTFAAALFLFALVLPMPAARMAWTTAQSIVKGVRSSGKI